MTDSDFPGPKVKMVLRLVTAVANWIGEHWVVSGAAVVAVAGWLGIRG